MEIPIFGDFWNLFESHWRLGSYRSPVCGLHRTAFVFFNPLKLKISMMAERELVHGGKPSHLPVALEIAVFQGAQVPEDFIHPQHYTTITILTTTIINITTTITCRFLCVNILIIPSRRNTVARQLPFFLHHTPQLRAGSCWAEFSASCGTLGFVGSGLGFRVRV